MKRQLCFAVSLSIVAASVPARAQGEAAHPPAQPTAGPTTAQAAPAGFAAPVPPADRDEDLAKNAVYAELLGNAILYSVNYERRFSDVVAARLGFSYFGLSASVSDATSSASARANFFLFPVMANFLVGGRNNKLELGVGALALIVSGSAEGVSFGEKVTATGAAAAVAGTATIGYRYQPRDGGFVFRVGATPIIGKGGALPWGGISFGGAF
jgi:hypothetical protein